MVNYFSKKEDKTAVEHSKKKIKNKRTQVSTIENLHSFGILETKKIIKLLKAIAITKLTILHNDNQFLIMRNTSNKILY